MILRPAVPEQTITDFGEKLDALKVDNCGMLPYNLHIDWGQKGEVVISYQEWNTILDYARIGYITSQGGGVGGGGSGSNIKV